MVSRILVRTPIPRKKETASAAKADESNRDYKQKYDGSNTNNKSNPVREQVKKSDSPFCSTKGCPHEKAANGSLCDGNPCHDVPPPLQGKPSNNKIADCNEVNSSQQNDDNDTASKKRPILMDDADDAVETTKRRKKFIDLTDVSPQLPILRSSKSGSCTSKYKGVSFNKARNKWRAQIKVDGKKCHIGFYDNEEEAAVDYARAAFKYPPPQSKPSSIDLMGVPPQLPIMRSKRGGSSQYQGVCFEKTRNKWQARITIDGKLHSLGYYDNEEEAAIDYARAVFKYRSDARRRGSDILTDNS